MLVICGRGGNFKTALPGDGVLWFRRFCWCCLAVFRVDWGSGSALLGGFLLAVAPKGTKRACPAIRPYASLRVRSLHRRSRGARRRAILGPSSLSRHPCRSTPSTTIPLTLLKGRLVLPDSSAFLFPRIACKRSDKEKPSGSSEPKSPSVGRVEVLRRGTRGRTPSEERWDRTSHRDGPRSSAGRREPRRRRGRMPGWPSLWLLSLGQTRESNSPCKAKSAVGAEESAASRLLSAGRQSGVQRIAPIPSRSV